jgi:apolipoprotein N-acyltransferase
VIDLAAGWLVSSSMSSGVAAKPPQLLSWRGRLIWVSVAAASFHLAYLFPPFVSLIGVYLFALWQLSRQGTRLQAMNTGWLLAFLVYAPHLAFFWTIFGPAAIALWLVLGFWLGLFLALVRFARERLGNTAAVLLAPFLWTGLEFFRSELYYLRFSWLNVGYAFSWTTTLPVFAWLGVYGIGLIMMASAAGLSLLSRRQAVVVGLAALAGLGLLTNLPRRDRESAAGRELRIAGMQLEFPVELEVPAMLDRLRAQYPDADLYVLPEYTFQDPVPKRVREWCRQNQKHLLVGGKEPLEGEQFFNTAYVIGPGGEIVFSQAKAQPIQFFKDGLPARQQLVWNSPWGRLGICICYDLGYTHLVDKLARQGAQAILAPTMDVEDWGRYQHRLHARIGPMRAAEYHIPVFRLASSGVSQIVTSAGNATQTKQFPGSGEMLGGVLRLGPPARLPLDRWLAWPAVLVSACVAVWGFWLALWDRKKGRTKPRSQGKGEQNREPALPVSSLGPDA